MNHFLKLSHCMFYISIFDGVSQGVNNSLDQKWLLEFKSASVFIIVDLHSKVGTHSLRSLSISQIQIPFQHLTMTMFHVYYQFGKLHCQWNKGCKTNVEAILFQQEYNNNPSNNGQNDCQWSSSSCCEENEVVKAQCCQQMKKKLRMTQHQYMLAFQHLIFL